MRAGSLVNKLYDEARNEVVPEVGMGGTMVGYTDRHACTVVEVSKTGHKLTVQRDKATRTDTNGMSDAQSYEFERDTEGVTREYTRRKDGAYREKGGEGRLLLGRREHYFDFSF